MYRMRAWASNESACAKQQRLTCACPSFLDSFRHATRLLFKQKQWRPYHDLRRELQKLVPTDYKKECQCQLNISEGDLAVKEDGVGSTIVAAGGAEDKGKKEK